MSYKLGDKYQNTALSTNSPPQPAHCTGNTTSSSTWRRLLVPVPWPSPCSRRPSPSSKPPSTSTTPAQMPPSCRNILFAPYPGTRQAPSSRLALPTGRCASGTRRRPMSKTRLSCAPKASGPSNALRSTQSTRMSLLAAVQTAWSASGTYDPTRPAWARSRWANSPLPWPGHPMGRKSLQGER